ncbi:MAG: LytTR family transcriptional regulator DNA-binding domain-containing protein [Bacteroidetes bacterium]|nr:LytTR family transcriptional regulator DNA-binding domain-containing protein [Bacteroidota bacterium]
MSNKIRTIIIDDEQLARSITNSYLSKHPEIEIVAECSNGFDAIKKINEEKPDLIFLDIQMPKINGFEMLELLEDPPAIIFTTAYDQFAIKAFEVSAVDYLLKPFSEERFNEALKKSYNHIQDKFQQNSAIKNIIKQNDERIEFLERVVIKEGAKISILPVESIKWIEAQDDYVMINSEQGRFIKKKTMRYFENHLNENMFIRIHRSYIINADYIQHLEQKGKESYRLILKNGKELPVSKTGLTKLKNTL